VNLKTYLVTRQKLIDRALDRYLPKANRKPTTLHRAMRYSLFAGGKRLRPILCLAAAEACRGKIDDALPLAMIFRVWITMISDAVVPPATRFSAKASPCSRVTLY
jgi:geranylgeranyl pyrophosphate synthase